MAYSKGGYKRYTPPARTSNRRRISNPSEYQEIIFKATQACANKALNNLRNGFNVVSAIHVEALAGSGKTSTTVEKDYFLPDSIKNDSVQVAFNSSIAGELSERVADGVECKTLHALGRAALVRAFPELNSPRALDTRKYDGYIKASIGDSPDVYEARDNLKLMIDRARDCCAWNKEDMAPLMDRFDIQTGHMTTDEFLSVAEKALIAGLKDVCRIDFGDMIAMPIYHNLNIRKYSCVSVDEAQDLCPAQHELLKRSLKPGGMFFSVGDENQAIYLWRSADIDSINNLCNHFNSARYALPRTYRCAKEIVKQAQELVPGLEYVDTAEDGAVEYIDATKVIDMIKPGDALISRINAPLIKFCFQFIRAGIPANIQGRDVAEDLKSLIKKSKASDVESLLNWIDQWRETEVNRRMRQRRFTTAIEDKAECIQVLCEGFTNVSDVLSAIDRLFSDKSEKNIVICSSTHRAKGKEWDRVFMLDSTYMLKNGNQQEEQNLVYVAITRAKKHLFRVSGK